MKKFTSAVLVMLVSIFCAVCSIADAAEDKDFAMCAGGSAITPAQQVEGCTNLINSGDLSKEHMAIAFNNRATVYLRTERYREALNGYEDALKMNAGYFTSILGKSSAYTELGDLPNAMVYADKALAVASPTQLADVHNQRCWIKAVSGHHLEEALGDCNTSFKHNANNAAAYNSRALVHFKMGNLKAALGDYQAGARLKKENPDFLYGMGVVEIHLGNTSEGTSHIAQAKAIRADIADKYSKYGLTLP